MKSQVGVLIGGILFAWLVVSYPAWRLGGSASLVQSATAMALCLVPAIGTFLGGLRALAGSPTDRLQHMFLSTLVRLAVVFGGGLVLYFSAAVFHEERFWFWVLGFYLATLGLETLLLHHAPQAKPAGLPGSNSSGAGQAPLSLNGDRMLAANPFHHVMDSDYWEILESQHWGFPIPPPVTKFMLLQLLSAVLILLIYIPIARRAQSGALPKGFFWNTFESLLTFLRDRVAKPNIGHHDADRFVPFLWTMFLYVLFNNLLGMLPFFGAPTADFTVTSVLALCAFTAIHLGAVLKLGVGGYMKSYVPHIEAPFGMSYLLVPGIVAIEVLGAFIKAFVLSVRLFANMLAGHTVTAVILGFIVVARHSDLFWGITTGSVLMVTAMSVLELFVAFLQAFIFTFLTSLFIGSALHPAH